jgi:thiazole/oxazole-forming peptide maturase SagD family component
MTVEGVLALALAGPRPERDRFPDAVRGELQRWSNLIAVTATEPRLLPGPPELHGHVGVFGRLVTAAGAVVAAGCARSADQAAGSFVGELVEHAVAANEHPPGAVRASATKLRAEGKEPLDVERYLGRPLDGGRWPCAPFSDDLELEWVRGRSLERDVDVWVPWSLVRFGGEGDEDLLVEPTAAGLAAGATLEAATEHALLEIVERDAVMARWLEGRTFDRLAPEVRPEWFEEFARADARIGWETVALAMQSWTGAAICVVLTRDSANRLFGIGSAATADFEARLDHALAEAVHCRLGAVLWRGKLHAIPIERARRSLAFMQPRSFSALGDLVGDVGPAGLADANDLRSLPERLAREGVDAVRAVVAESGSAVVRVLAPGLQPMYMRPEFARLVPPTRVVARESHVTHPFG